MNNIKKTQWQDALSDLITDPKELFSLLALDPALLPAAYQAAKLFPLKIPRAFLTRIEKSNPHDPLLRQFLPLTNELLTVPGYHANPLKEDAVNPIPGLLHKYHGRVLITLTSACAVHCRYCFRRDFPYVDNNPGRLGWEKIMAYLNQDKTLREVILSGGDPLVVNDKLLGIFSDQLANIPHIKLLRLHTRLPIVLPERITSELLAWIAGLKQQLVMVIHANHPNELTDDVKQVLQHLKQAGVSLLNQAVLLKGVNDNIETLVSLHETLFAVGVLPYYLHVLDKVKGTAHFDLPLTVAKQLHQAMQARLPGYLVPRLSVEEPGKPGKTWLSTEWG